MSEERVAQLVRAVAEDLPVGAAPVDAVVRRGRRRTRARRAVMAGAVVCAMVVVAAGVVMARPSDRERIPAGVVRVDNPLPVPWWGDGTLHLADVTVPAAHVTDLVAVGDSVAFGTEGGDVVLVQSDGRRTTVGHKSFEAPMAAGDDGWLTWVDPRDRAPQLVVYDVAAGSELGRIDLPYRGPRWDRLDGGSYPIDVDDGKVYYATQDGDWSWAPGDDKPLLVSPVDIDLLDVASGARVAHGWSDPAGWDETLMVTRPGAGAPSTYPGDGGWFSHDGNYLATRGEDGLDVFRFGDTAPLRLDVPREFDGSDTDLAFTNDSTVVVRTGGVPRPAPTTPMEGITIAGYDTWDLSTCDLATGECTTIKNATTDAPPLLPR